MVDLMRETITVDSDLEEIIPGYLKNRQKDLKSIAEALSEQDFSTIQTLGHRMKGSGSGYGLHKVTEIGEQLEAAAVRSDTGKIAELCAALHDFVERIDIVFKEI